MQEEEEASEATCVVDFMMTYRTTIFQGKEGGLSNEFATIYVVLTDFVRGPFDNIGPNNVSRSTEQCRQCRLRSIPHMMSKEVNEKAAAGYSSVTCKLYVNVDNRPEEADGNQ